MTAAACHAEVAGAGFAGLAAATAVCRGGWTLPVHAADAELRAFGARIRIWDNGRLDPQAHGALAEVEDGANAQLEADQGRG
jgi:2-methyl-3-hydroxypyridine 5-carboxylic acid dioxygenase